MKISIIIPVYNSEKYLRECFDSVLAQTYTDFEVLMIDDGSTDSSGKICDEYAEKDSRFKVFHKENGGVSSARNFGIEKAKGKWISFMDSDDYLEPDYLNNNYDLTDVDLIIQSFYSVGDNNRIKVTFGNETVNADDYKTLFEDKELFKFGYPFSKFFKKSIIDKNHFRFPESFSFAEDLSFLLKYMTASKKIKFDDTAQYNYVAHPNSLSRTFKKPQEYWNRYIDYKEIIKKDYPEVYRHVSGSNISYKEFTRSIGGAIFYYLQSIYKDKNLTSQNRRDLLQKIKSEDLKITKNFMSHINHPGYKIGILLLVYYKIKLADIIFNLTIK